MNKNQLFRLATLTFLTLLFFLMPLFINDVPTTENGTIALIYNKIASILNLNLVQKVHGAQWINAIFIWLTIFIVTRFVKLLLGWRAALFSAILLFLSPRFIGASLLNLIDIPFAFAYILTITLIYTFVRELPRYKLKRVISLTLSALFTTCIHPAGSILIIYILVFPIIALILKINVKWHFITHKKQAVFKLITIISSLALLVFLVAVLVSKFIYKIPINQPLEALNMFNDFTNVDYQIFDSKLWVQSDLPNYYLLKYLFITTPLVILIGVFLFFVLIYVKRKEQNPLLIYVILGTLLFPLIFSYFSNMTANAYWSIYYMSVPLIIILSVMGVEYILRTIDDRYVNSVIVFVLFLLLLPPLRHVTVTAPATSSYFNEFSGNISSSYGKYSLDLNAHHPKMASKMLMKFIYNFEIRGLKDSKTILVYTDATINCELYFVEYPFVKVQYGTLEQFHNGKGDYFISFADKQTPQVLKNELWPPTNVLFTMYVENVPIATFLKRK